MIEVRGWMAEDERMMLRRCAFGKKALEIGAYQGLSTAQLAYTANFVVTVDTFDSRGTVYYPQDTQEAFLKTLKETGTEGKVQAIKGLSSEILPAFPPKSFDLIFIDGSHDYESVSLDIKLARPLLKDDGVLAFHDCTDQHPGVFRAVSELEGAHLIEQANSLVAFRFDSPQQKKPVKVAVCMPHRGDLICNLGAAAGLLSWPTTKGLPVELLNHGTSILTHSFNVLLAMALNARKEGVTHMAMLHNDIIPCKGWVDIELEEMERLDLDMVSAVVPIKNQKGLTSTGLDDPDDPWSVRRLTMEEVFDLPETFTAKDVPYRKNEGPLLVNSGCFLIKLTEPWIEGMCFKQKDRMAYDVKAGEYAAQSISEDFLWSRELYMRGGRIGATRKVTLCHERPEFHNKSRWGTWKTDETYLKHQKELEEEYAVHA